MKGFWTYSFAFLAVVAAILASFVLAGAARAQVEGITYSRMQQAWGQSAAPELYSPFNNAKTDSVWNYLMAHGTIADTPVYAATKITARSLAAVSAGPVTTVAEYPQSRLALWQYTVAGGIPSMHSDSGNVLTSQGDVFAPAWLPAGGTVDSVRASHVSDTALHVPTVDSVRASHIADTSKVTHYADTAKVAHYADSTGKIPATAVTPGSYTNTNLTVNQSGQITAASNGSTSSGTVTSFSSGDFPPLFTASVATSTTTPALSFTAVAQSPNIVFAGPTSGGAVAAAFRSLVAADLPSTAVTPGSYTLTNITVDAQGRITAASNGSALTNPLTTLGDMPYSSDNSGTLARLPRGDSTMFLGIRSVTHIPAWTDTLFRNSNATTVPAPAIVFANTAVTTNSNTLAYPGSIWWLAHYWNITATAHDSSTQAHIGLEVKSSIYGTALLNFYVGNPTGVQSNNTVLSLIGESSNAVTTGASGFNATMASRNASIAEGVMNCAIIGGGASATTSSAANSIGGPQGNGNVIIGGRFNFLSTQSVGSTYLGFSTIVGGEGNEVLAGYSSTVAGNKDTIDNAILLAGNTGQGMVALGGTGLYPKANDQVVIGRWNTVDATHGNLATDTAFVIGNGTGVVSGGLPNRHTALTINKLGDIGMQGHIITRDTVGAATDDATGITSASVVGSDVAGTITVTSTLAAGGGWVQVAFGRVYGTVPTVVISPSNANANALSIADGAYVTATAAAFKINWSATIAETGATYNYIVIAPK